MNKQLKANWLVICYHDYADGSMGIVHSVVYEQEPILNELESLRKELATDKSLGMINDKTYKMMIVSRKLVPAIFESLNIPEYF